MLRLCFLVFVAFATNSFAASFSDLRIFLDDKNRFKDFYITNDTARDETCTFKFTYTGYDNSGVKIENLPEELQNNKLNEFYDAVRFSPKNLVLKPKQTQKIRFMLKRSVNRNAREFRSYINVRCAESELQGNVNQFTLSPVLVQRFPVVVRVGDLNGSISVNNVKKNDNSLNFDILREGKRSVYGTLTVLNERNEVLKRWKGIAIYPESNSRTFSITNSLVKQSQVISVQFNEDTRYGGEINFEQKVRL